MTVDGAEQRIYRTHGQFRGVFLPGGTHEVVFVFRPPRVLLGGALSLGGLAMACVLLVAGARRRPRITGASGSQVEAARAPALPRVPS